MNTEEHIVIGENRFIYVPTSLKRIAVQYDHDIETVTFDCPRYWDGLDMSTMRVFINYMLADGTPGCYIAKNVTVDETDPNLIHFEWTISRNVTMVKGTVSFLICIKRSDIDGYEINHWNSELNRDMYVSEGMECIEMILAEYPDVVAQLLEHMEATDERTSVESMKKYVQEYVDENYSEILIDRIDEHVTSEVTQQFVDNYLTENPLLIDKTLTEENRAADAKATGEAIEQAKKDIIDDTLGVEGKAADAKATSEAIEQAKKDIIDDTLSVEGKAAEAKATSTAINTAKQNVLDVINDINTLNILRPDPTGWKTGEKCEAYQSIYRNSGYFVNGMIVLEDSYTETRYEYETDEETGEEIQNDYEVTIYTLGYSTDGLTWTCSSSENSIAELREAIGIDSITANVAMYDAYAYGKGVYVRVGRQSVNTNPYASFSYSTDGITWNGGTVSKIANYAWPMNVVYGNGRFVAINNGSGQGNTNMLRYMDIWYSSDGINWSYNDEYSYTLDEDAPHSTDLIYDPETSLFWIFDSANRYCSSDGETWTKFTDSISFVKCRSVVSVGGRFYALCNYATKSSTNSYITTYTDLKLYQSVDGVRWSEVIDNTNSMPGVTENATRLFVLNNSLVRMDGDTPNRLSFIDDPESIADILKKLYDACSQAGLV